MATKIIKFNDGINTYVPVTLASAVQYRYGENSVTSVQEVIGLTAGSVVNHINSKGDATTYGHVIVDSELSATSVNPVQNKVINTALSGKADSAHSHTLTWSTNSKTTDAGTEIAALVAVPNQDTSLGSSAATATFTTYILPTKKYVDDAVTEAIADVASALKYKGTIGSGTATATHVNSLPASHDVGDVWVVSSAGTYAGKACEVGDYIVCNTKGTAVNDAHWDVLNGENQVSQTNSEFTVGAGSKELAKVDGTSINLKIVQEADVAHMSDFASYVKTISSDPTTSPNGVITSAVKTNQDIKFTYTDVSSSGNATAATTLSATAKTITPGWAQDSNGKITSVTGVSIKQDHEGTGAAGKLTYWSGTDTHTAVTSSYGNSSSKYVYVDAGVLKEGTLPEGNKEGKNVVGSSADAITDETASDGNLYLNHIENGSVKSSHNIVGSSDIAVTATSGGTVISIAHATNAGHKHIPTGGSANQVLKYSASGTAAWSNLSEGLKYEVYNSNDDFTLDLGESVGSVSLAKTTF